MFDKIITSDEVKFNDLEKKVFKFVCFFGCLIIKLMIDVNVNSFCSFLAKKYVGFWQRFIRGGFPLFIVFLYLKMLLLNYQQMLLR